MRPRGATLLLVAVLATAPVAASDPWLTRAEESGFVATSTLAETVGLLPVFRLLAPLTATTEPYLP